MRRPYSRAPNVRLFVLVVGSQTAGTRSGVKDPSDSIIMATGVELSSDSS
jgi:hypothetical protein